MHVARSSVISLLGKCNHHRSAFVTSGDSFTLSELRADIAKGRELVTRLFNIPLMAAPPGIDTMGHLYATVANSGRGGSKAAQLTQQANERTLAFIAQARRFDRAHDIAQRPGATSQVQLGARVAVEAALLEETRAAAAYAAAVCGAPQPSGDSAEPLLDPRDVASRLAAPLPGRSADHFRGRSRSRDRDFDGTGQQRGHQYLARRGDDSESRQRQLDASDDHRPRRDDSGGLHAMGARRYDSPFPRDNAQEWRARTRDSGSERYSSEYDERARHLREQEEADRVRRHRELEEADRLRLLREREEADHARRFREREEARLREREDVWRLREREEADRAWRLREREEAARGWHRFPRDASPERYSMQYDRPRPRDFAGHVSAAEIAAALVRKVTAKADDYSRSSSADAVAARNAAYRSQAAMRQEPTPGTRKATDAEWSAHLDVIERAAPSYVASDSVDLRPATVVNIPMMPWPSKSERFTDNAAHFALHDGSSSTTGTAFTSASMRLAFDTACNAALRAGHPDADLIGVGFLSTMGGAFLHHEARSRNLMQGGYYTAGGCYTPSTAPEATIHSPTSYADACVGTTATLERADAWMPAKYCAMAGFADAVTVDTTASYTALERCLRRRDTLAEEVRLKTGIFYTEAWSILNGMVMIGEPLLALSPDAGRFAQRLGAMPGRSIAPQSFWSLRLRAKHLGASAPPAIPPPPAPPIASRLESALASSYAPGHHPHGERGAGASDRAYAGRGSSAQQRSGGSSSGGAGSSPHYASHLQRQSGGGAQYSHAGGGRSAQLNRAVAFDIGARAGRSPSPRRRPDEDAGRSAGPLPSQRSEAAGAVAGRR